MLKKLVNQTLSLATWSVHGFCAESAPTDKVGTQDFAPGMSLWGCLTSITHGSNTRTDDPAIARHTAFQAQRFYLRAAFVARSLHGLLT